jgi:hypothetical protein
MSILACAETEDPADKTKDAGDASDSSSEVGGSAGVSGAAGASGAGGSAGSDDGGSDADAADAVSEPPSTCGNGQLDPGEACEGDDFGGKTCASIGLGSGTLLCNAYCSIVASSCVPLEQCSDGKDNDDDGLFDCDDEDDCSSKVPCTDSCASPKTAVVGGVVFGDTTGKPSNIVPSCNAASGSEAVYQFTSPVTDKLKLNLQGGGKLSLSVRTACDDVVSEVACGNLDNNGVTKSIGMDAVAGTKYFVIIDEPANEPGTWFDLEIVVVKLEGDCSNLMDDDVDQLVDCDDPSNCQSSSDCTPGTGATGSACIFNNQCFATGNDPLCLQDPLWPGGYCSEFCDPSSPCAAGALCFDLGLSLHGVCLDTCVTATDCRPGYDCVDKGLSQKVCYVPSEWKCGDFVDNDNDSLIDCEDADKCQTLPACLTGPNPVGTTCSLANECQAVGKDPLCLLNQNFTNWSDGYCSEFCNLTTNDCPNGGYCSDALSLASGNGVCLDSCTTGFDCRPNYDCAPTAAGGSACVPFGVSP